MVFLAVIAAWALKWALALAARRGERRSPSLSRFRLIAAGRARPVLRSQDYHLGSKFAFNVLRR